MVKQRVRTGLLHKLPQIHHADTPAEIFDDVQAMGDE